MTSKEFFMRLDNNETFHTDELEDLFYGDLIDYNEEEELIFEDEMDGSMGRWSHRVSRVYNIVGRYIECYGDIGNTEYQDNGFYEQPIEVKPVEKTITVIEYEPV